MKSYQKILISVLIGLAAFPTIGLGSSIVVSLIQGKTPAEAVQILAEQIDSLVDRVGIVETKQGEQEQTTSDIQSFVDQQQDTINQQKDLIEELQLLQQYSQTQISKEEACRKKDEFFDQATRILACDFNNKWWDSNQIEGTIDAIVACLQNEMSEELWLGESGTKAFGTITVFNGYSSEPQLLIASTRFLSSNERIFRTTKNIDIPGAQLNDDEIIPSSISVEIVADYLGAEYNIGPSDFTIPGFKGSPKYQGFYGKSSTAMSGGSSDTIEDAGLKNEYQNKLNQLNLLNSQFKAVKIMCEE